MNRSSPHKAVVGFCAAIVAWACAPAAAQDSASLEQFQRSLEQVERDTFLRIDEEVPLEQRTLFDYGAYASYYFLSLDDSNGQNHDLHQYELNAYARVNVDGVHQFFIRGRFGYQDFNEGEDFDGEGDQQIGPRLERAVYTFDLARARAAYDGENVDYNLIVKGGRQLVHWGNGLVLSRVLDGGTVIGKLGNVQVEAIGGTTVRQQTDIDSSRPEFDEYTERNFYGGMLSVDVAGHKPYVYGLVQVDDNKDRSTTDFTYDSHYIGVGVQGPVGDKILYGVEAAFEGGSSASNGGVIPQTREDIHAWALDGRLDYLVGDGHDSRLSLEMLFASGDDDRSASTTNTIGGNLAGTNDDAFNAFGFINTGLAFAGDVSNLFMVRLGGSTYPLRGVDMVDKLQVGLDFFILKKLEDDAPSTSPSSDGDGALGTEFDLYANWQVTSDVSVLLRYGVYLPGDAVTSDDAPRHFFFSGLTFGF